jgi:quercetin dioxygenase-like cupin family protein
MTAYVHHLEDMPVKEEMPGVCKRVLVGAEHGAQKFYLRHYDLAPDVTTPLDRHVYEHELFVLNGEGKYLCDGEETPIKTGDAIWIRSNQRHQIINTGPGRMQLLCCRGAEAIYQAETP